jgi:hypothetical protein
MESEQAAPVTIFMQGEDSFQRKTSDTSLMAPPDTQLVDADTGASSEALETALPTHRSKKIPIWLL